MRPGCGGRGRQSHPSGSHDPEGAPCPGRWQAPRTGSKGSPQPPAASPRMPVGTPGSPRPPRVPALTARDAGLTTRRSRGWAGQAQSHLSEASQGPKSSSVSLVPTLPCRKARMRPASPGSPAPPVAACCSTDAAGDGKVPKPLHTHHHVPCDTSDSRKRFRAVFEPKQLLSCGSGSSSPGRAGGLRGAGWLHSHSDAPVTRTRAVRRRSKDTACSHMASRGLGLRHAPAV